MNDEYPSDAGDLTRALAGSAAQEPGELLDAVLPLVYAELRLLAARTLRPQGPTSVQPTDLVHEAYLRLSGERSGWPDRANFMVAAAVAMRRVLVDRLRRRRSLKRGGAHVRKDELDQVSIEHQRFEALEVEEALQRLENEDSAAAAVAELYVYGGLNHEECAEALSVSTRTIERRWRFARAWLVAELREEGES